MFSSTREAEAGIRHGDAALAENRPQAARDLWETALASDPGRADVHARLMRLTGFAAESTASDGAALELARAHPYDPRVLLRAAHAQRRAGNVAAANELLERVLWLADLDPPSAEAAAVLLADRSPAWRGRLWVPVYVYADESIRAEPGWKFRLRGVVLALSNALADGLNVRFTLVSIAPLETESGGADLESIHRLFTRATTPAPGPGILMAVTGRPVPVGASAGKEGIAEFLGRRLSVRLAPDSNRIWTLAHEVLHLYGAIHVAHDVDSLMNPTGDDTDLDADNRRCVNAMRRRSFDVDSARADSIPRDVLARVDLREAVDAYAIALADNRALQRIEAGKVVARDEGLGDAARIVAGIMLAAGRNRQAVALFDAAGQLYGPETRQGLETATMADSLRAGRGSGSRH